MKPLNFAIAEIGKQEIPQGSNWGPDVQKYLKSVGINFPASWCMAFVYWCFEEWENITGIPNPLIKTGGVLAEWNQIPAKFKMPAPFVNPPLPGDVFIMDFGKGLGHTGFVESVDADGTLHTIEGNTNNDGSRNGYEVERKTRHVHSIKGIIRIPLPD